MNIHWLKMTDSTNLDAWRNKDTEPDGTVWCAGYQTAGRGQRGNRWESRAGENLMFSILFKPECIKAQDQFAISQVCALGVACYLENMGLEARIKWPNDVYVGDRKICGMLIENILSGGMVSASIAGIGINLNQREFSPELPNPTSVVLEAERKGNTLPVLQPERELPEVLDRISEMYSRLGMEGSDCLDDMYESRLYRLGVSAVFEETAYFTGGDERRFVGKILGVEKKTARLIVEKEDGLKVKYYFKEIRFVL